MADRHNHAHLKRFFQKPSTSFVFRILISGILIFYLLRIAAFTNIITVIQRLDFKAFLIYYLLFFIGLIAHVLRWGQLLKGWGIAVRFKYLLRWTLIGLFLNIFFPGGLGGDAYRLLAGKRSAGNIEDLAASLVYERLISYSSLVCLGLGALVMRASFSEDRIFWILLGSISFLLAGFFAILGLPCLTQFAIKIAERSNLLTRVKLAAWLKSFQFSKKMLPIFLTVFLISALIQIMEILLYYIVATAIQLPIPLSELFVFVPLLLLALILPLSISGVGVRETVFVVFASRWGISQAEAVAFSLTVFSLTIFGSLIGGPLLLFNRKARKNKDFGS